MAYLFMGRREAGLGSEGLFIRAERERERGEKLKNTYMALLQFLPTPPVLQTSGPDPGSYRRKM